MVNSAISQSRRMVIMVSQDRLVGKSMSSRWVGETHGYCVVECDRLEKYGGVGVDFSNLKRKIVIKLLKFYSLCNRWHSQNKVPDRISNERFIDQLVSHYIWVPFELIHDLEPELSELFIQVGSFSVEFIKSIADVIAKVILAPAILVTLIPSRQPTLIELDLLAHGERECFVQFELVGQPSRYAIATELFGNQILMEVNQSVYAMTASLVNQVLHDIQVCFIVFILLRFNSCPPALQIFYIIPSRMPLYPHLVQLIMSSSEKDHSGSQASMRGIQGGTLTTTLVPWIMSSLPCSSMSFLFIIDRFRATQISKATRTMCDLVINLLWQIIIIKNQMTLSIFSPMMSRKRVSMTSLQKVGQYLQARLQSGEKVISRSLGSIVSSSIMTSIPYMALLLSFCILGYLVLAAMKVFLSIFFIFSFTSSHLWGWQSFSNSSMKSIYFICLKSLTGPQFITVNWVSQVDRYRRSTVYGLLELLIQKCLYRNMFNGFTDLTKRMQRKSTLRPCLSTGLRMYFWAILGPVSMLLMMMDKLSVISISIDLAILGGLIIHRLSSPRSCLEQQSPIIQGRWRSKSYVLIKQGVLPSTDCTVSARLCLSTTLDSQGNWLMYLSLNCGQFSSSRAPLSHTISASSTFFTNSICL